MESNYGHNTVPSPQSTMRPKRLSGWGSFIGVLSIISGTILSLTIALAVFGIPIIVAGVKLLKAVTLSEEPTAYDPKVDEVFINLNSYFKICGIVFICSIVLFIVVLVTLFSLGFLGQLFSAF